VNARLLALLWLLLGIAVWNAFFDLYVSRGAREYLQLLAESELGLTTAPQMAEVMGRAKSMGVTGATIWALIIVGTGWATVAVCRRTGRIQRS
jgi:hypothetical protein